MFPSSSLSSSPIVYSLTLFVSLFFLLFCTPQILHPLRNRHREPLISARDELDDLNLFRKATTRCGSSKISHLRTVNPKPKIAFLFLTNSDLIFAPLWQIFFESSVNDGLFNVYIHVDPSAKISIPEWLIKANFIPAKPTARASPTLISAARRLMANAIIDDPFNLYFALVSQHCIPLHSFKFIYTSLFGNPSSASKAFLTQRSHKSYIEILSDAPYCITGTSLEATARCCRKYAQRLTERGFFNTEARHVALDAPKLSEAQQGSEARCGLKTLCSFIEIPTELFREALSTSSLLVDLAYISMLSWGEGWSGGSGSGEGTTTRYGSSRQRWMGVVRPPLSYLGSFSTKNKKVGEGDFERWFVFVRIRR
ncbi:putative inactive tRNA-specific adenosine deaminase-like protein 3-like [Hibiscus syriacus]|uniref:Inactive tRNA-specific adenosine deaminase-like protein 3-like n=1 Tax=Hibiscus syriacus TaxID=106335 RepID=A0A6A3BNM0_HIBSY|nr:putative inactive tRNA-specific adenosine deaminase-like protein 3-like [Hibiscus syriacus]